MTMEYENSKNDKDRDNIGHFVEVIIKPTSH